VYSRSSKPIPAASGIGWEASSLVLSTFSYAAVWAGMYVSGAVVCLAQVAALDALVRPKVKLAAAAFAFCTATGVYLLDRVKLRDEWLDPADAQAHPGRFAFIADHSAFVRGLMLALLMTAGWVGARVLTWGAAVPVMAAAGVLIYAGRPRAGRPRPKDILVLKNVYVAAGITGFAAIVALAAVRPDARLVTMRDIAADHAGPLAIACAFLAVRVLADAVLCDLDDEEADRQFGTGTLPIHLGRNRAWQAAMAVRICAAGLLVMVPIVPLWVRLSWAGVTIVSSLTMRLAAPIRVRDWVDARFVAEAVVVTVILCLAR
jgi:4-hydroxybenzoate polyprenyltransferase